MVNYKKAKKERQERENPKRSRWTRFWSWYERQFTKNLVVMAVILYLQIPHMIWAGDIFLELGIISRIHPVIDFFLYGVDLIEVLAMVYIGMMIYSRVRKCRT